MNARTSFIAAVTFGALVAGFAAPSRAQTSFQGTSDSCVSLLMPALQLKQVARGYTSYHPGLDLTAPYGSPVRAAMGGSVIFAGTYFGYGNMIDIQLGDGTVTRYAHLSAYAAGLRVGRMIATGEQIGRIGTSGHAHGAHLHFEVRINGRAADPKPYLALAACTPAQRPLLEEARAPEPAARAGALPASDARPGGLFQ
jgi:murein DD-endopeptidase MepM/ murein hydrolase activator NlpD